MHTNHFNSARIFEVQIFMNSDVVFNRNEDEQKYNRVEYIATV